MGRLVSLKFLQINIYLTTNNISYQIRVILQFLVLRKQKQNILRHSK